MGAAGPVVDVGCRACTARGDEDPGGAWDLVHGSAGKPAEGPAGQGWGAGARVQPGVAGGGDGLGQAAGHRLPGFSGGDVLPDAGAGGGGGAFTPGRCG